MGVVPRRIRTPIEIQAARTILKRFGKTLGDLELLRKQPLMRLRAMNAREYFDQVQPRDEAKFRHFVRQEKVMIRHNSCFADEKAAPADEFLIAVNLNVEVLPRLTSR